MKTLTQFMPQKEEHLVLHPGDMISLKEAGLNGGAFAMRELDQENLESLMRSDPETWPALKVTLCTRGYLIIDGYHRWEVAKRLQRDHLVVNCEPFTNENDIIEAAFRANLHHGLKASVENKSDYAYWLHKTYPDLEQAAIAQRVGVTQSTVSKAIMRREEEIRRARQQEEALDEKTRKNLAKKSCRAFTRVAMRFLGEVQELNDAELAQLLQDVVKKDDDRAKLTRIGRLLSTGDTATNQLFGQFQTKPPNEDMLQNWAQKN